jgi:hypothetical protein
MRTRVKARAATGVLSVALAAANAYASEPEVQCTTNRSGSWTISMTGPSSVPCPDGGQCTALGYQIFGNAGRRPSRAAVLVEYDVDLVEPTADQVSEACGGDRRTRLGLNDCLHKTVKINLGTGPGPKSFEIVARGLRDVVASAVVVRGAGGTGAPEGCSIASLGSVAFHPNQQILSSQQIYFKGCTVTIPTDAVTGEGAPGTITGENCVFVANAAPVTEGELKINGQSVGTLSFGNGSISSGTASCATKIINRRLYTWCTCDDVDGDGIPDDPIPPCPAAVP